MTTPPVDPIAALIALPGNIVSFAVDLIAAVFTPLFTGGPSVPADTPVLWAVLALVRRQFFNTSPTLAPANQVANPTTGQLYGTLGATDADGDPLTYEVLQGPAHGIVAVNANGQYVYQPTAGYVGADSFTVAVSDGGAHVHGLSGLASPYGPHATVATIGLTAVTVVTGANTPPVIVAPGVLDPVTGATRYTVTTTDSPGDTVTVAVTTPPVRGTLAQDSTDPLVYVYTPDATYAHSLALGGNRNPGADTITFTATDSAGATAAVTVAPVITPVNAAPTLSIVTEPTGAANGAVKVTITYADADGDTPLTATTSTPQYGYYAYTVDGPAVTITSPSPVPGSAAPTTNVAYYIPNPATPGTETLSFSLTDGYGGTVVRTQTVTVDPAVNHAPTVTLTTTPTGAADGSLYVTITYGEQDDDVVIATLSTPEHGIYTYEGQVISGFTSDPVDFGPGEQSITLVYTPNPSKPGTETISFTLKDAAGLSAKASTDVVVSGTGVNQNPLGYITIGEPGGNGAVDVAVTFYDPEGDDVTVFYPIPDAGTLTYVDSTYDEDSGQTTQFYVYQPYAPSRGAAYYTDGDDVETLVFDISDTDDEFGDNTVIEVDVPISPLAPVVNNHAPTVTLTSGPTGDADGSVLVTINFGEEDDDNVTLTLSDPEHGTYDYGQGPQATGFTVTGPFGPIQNTVTLRYIPDPTKPGTETISFTLTDAAGEIASDSVDVIVSGNDGYVVTTPINGAPSQTDGRVTGSFVFVSPDGAAIAALVAEEDQPTYGTVEVTVAPSGVANSYTVTYVYTPDPLARLDAFSGGPTEDTFVVSISGTSGVVQVASFARTAAPFAAAGAPRPVPVTVPVAPANSVVLDTWPNDYATDNAVVAADGTIYQPYSSPDGGTYIRILGRGTPIPIEGGIQSIRAVGSTVVVASSISGSQRSVISFITPDGEVTAFDAPVGIDAHDVFVSDGVVYLHNQDHLYRVTPAGVSPDLSPFPDSFASTFIVGNTVYYAKNIGTNSVGLYKVGLAAPMTTFVVDATHRFGVYGGANGLLYAAAQNFTGSTPVQTLYVFESSSNVPTTFNVGNDFSLSVNAYGVAPDGTLFLNVVGTNRYSTHFSPGASSFSPLVQVPAVGYPVSTVYGPSSAYNLQSVSNGSAAPTIVVVNLFNGASSASIAGYAPFPLTVGPDGNAYLAVFPSQGAVEVWRVGPDGGTAKVYTGDSALLAYGNNAFTLGPVAVGPDGRIYVTNNVANGQPGDPGASNTIQLIAIAG
ncbi:Ig-like domain-containing protein [Mycobacterium sp. NPDC006124]|uniref:Ig-like domain-containing protein n=1 Tax=Mycobacterium sp. NPDC006124 TaxID=3156729 RepID=UPI0033BF5F2C